MRISDWSSDVCSSDLVMKVILFAAALTVSSVALAQDTTDDQTNTDETMGTEQPMETDPTVPPPAETMPPPADTTAPTPAETMPPATTRAPPTGPPTTVAPGNENQNANRNTNEVGKSGYERGGQMGG